MKNLYTKNEFLTLRGEGEMITEGLGGFIKKMFQNVMKLSNKIKGSKEITDLYKKYTEEINNIFGKFSNVEGAGTVKDVKESVENRLNEAEAEVELSDEEQKLNLTNIKDNQLGELRKKTLERLEQLKKEFDIEVSSVIERLSKNKNYSSDKLKRFAVIMKNKMQGDIYNKWYEFYTKLGDKDAILKVTELKKKNDANFKVALKELNTGISEQQKEINVEPDGKYIYHNSDGEDVSVTVIGKGLGLDENGKEDGDPDHKKLWKIKTDETEKVFWITPLKMSLPEKKALDNGVNKDNVEVGKKYSWISDKGDGKMGTIVDGGDGSPVFGDEDKTVKIQSDTPNTQPFLIALSKLNPVKATVK